MIETQSQIRQATNILETASKEYKRALEEKLHLQNLLIAENEKIILMLKQNN